MIYFIGNKEADICKIGYSKKKNVKGRISILQTACPFELELINSIEGDLYVETRLHLHFKAQKIKGEWYKLSKIDPFISLEEVKEIDNRPIPVKHNPGRKALDFPEWVIESLEKESKDQKRSLKAHMEYILNMHAAGNEITNPLKIILKK